MNDAVHTTSPVRSRETVGNSPESSKTRKRVQVLEKDDDLVLASMWLAFRGAASASVEQSSEPLTNPQISLYGSYYGTLIPNTESGEGVVSSGVVVQVLDYYPYGSARINSSTGGFDEKKKYIGQYYDEDTALSYLNARYYDGARGQFTSQDPTHLAIGDPVRVVQVTGKSQDYFLSDPQLLNSYSYARNNPITLSDPQGTCPVCAAALVYIGRAVLVNAAINTVALYGSDVYHNINSNGAAWSDFQPSSAPSQYGEALVSGGASGLAGGAGGYGAKLFKASQLIGTAIGVGAGEAIYTGSQGAANNNFSFGDTLTEGARGVFSTYVGGKIIGNVPGRDVKSITSPNFYTGAHMQNEIKTGVVSQAVRSAAPSYSSVISGLQQVVNSLSSYIGSLKSNNKKDK